MEVLGSSNFSPQRTIDSIVGDIEIPDIVDRQMPPYQRVKARASRTHEPHEVHPSVLAELVEKIVDAEGLINQDDVSRRVAEAFGNERAGARIFSATLKALRRAKQKSDHLRDQDELWYTLAQQKSPPVRNRSEEQGPTLKAESISLMEIGAAISIPHAYNADGNADELVRSVSQLLGFRRIRPELKMRLQMGMSIR